MSKMGLRRLICGIGVAGRFRSVRDYSSSMRLSAANAAVVWPTPRVIVPVVDMGCKLRSLAAESVFDVNKRSLGGDAAEAEFVGSSQGWVALFNKSKDALFLSTPVSDRRRRPRISLPPVRTLPEPYLNLDLDGNASVSKVILSSSPDDEDCCAMMIFGAANRLAFCFPNRSPSEWTPIGSLFRPDRRWLPCVKFVYVHEDLVYCSRRKTFTSVSPCEIIDWERFSLRDPRLVTQRSYVDCRGMYYYFAPTISHFSFERPLYKTRLQLRTAGAVELRMEQGGVTQIWVEENKRFLEKYCIQIPHLVYAEHSDQLFLVLRFVRLIHNYSRDYIPYCAMKGLKEVFECQTFGFLVMEVDGEGDCRVVDDLNGMAMFVGINNSFAIPAAANQFKANSIYFTDAKRSRMMCGVNDNGIFDYQTKEISHKDICGGIFSEV